LKPTLEIHLQKRIPLSRENAQSSQDLVAKAVIFPRNTRKKRMIISAYAHACAPVFWKRIKYGALQPMAVLRSPMQKSIVTSIARPRTTFRMKIHHIALGTFKNAFSTSSAMSNISAFACNIR
jgi:hypothetical protein